MSTMQLPTLRITSAADLVAAMPTLIGFTPEESLVIVFLKRDVVTLTTRLDLGEITHELNDFVVTTGNRVQADAALIATYTSDASDPWSHRFLIQGTSAALNDAGIDVRDALSVIGDRYWSYTCLDPLCCDPSGMEFSTASLGSEVVSTSRSDIVVRYTARPELSPTSGLLEQAELESDPDMFMRATHAWDVLKCLTDFGRTGTESPATDLFRSQFMVWCQHVHVRDFVMCSLAAGEGQADDMVDAIADLALCSPVELRPRLAGMAAALLAAFGHSSVPASCLVELAEDDSLAQLVNESIKTAVPPQAMRNMLAQGLPEVLKAIQNTQHS